MCFSYVFLYYSDALIYLNIYWALVVVLYWVSLISELYNEIFLFIFELLIYNSPTSTAYVQNLISKEA